MERTSAVPGHRESRRGDGGLDALGHESLTALRRLALPAIGLAGVMALLGLLVTKVLTNDWVGREDRQVDADLAGRRTATGRTVTSIFTHFAETLTVVALTVLAAVVFRLVFHRWRESVIIVCAVVGETAIFTLTTLLIDRKRPDVPKLDAAPPTSSFPSGHTAAAVAFYGTVAVIVVWHTRRVWLRWLVVLVAIAIPFLVGASRLYRGMHFPTDVLAGLLLGTAWSSTVAARLRPDRDD